MTLLLLLCAFHHSPSSPDIRLLLLGPVERSTDQVGCSPELDTDDSLNLCEQLLVGYSSSRFDVGDLQVSDNSVTGTGTDQIEGVCLHRLVWH